MRVAVWEVVWVCGRVCGCVGGGARVSLVLLFCQINISAN